MAEMKRVVYGSLRSSSLYAMCIVMVNPIAAIYIPLRKKLLIALDFLCYLESNHRYCSV